MEPKQLISQPFAERINLNQSEILDLINSVVAAYQLGTLTEAKGIEVGYEDVNFILTTNSGKYLLKVLVDFMAKKPRSEADSRRYVDTMETLRAEGVPIPKLYQANDAYLLKQVIPHNTDPVWMLVMEFFDGKDFIVQQSTLEDVKVVARMLTKINSSKMVREPMYDPWEPQFLLKEYEENVTLLTEENKTLIGEVLEKFKRIDLHTLPKSPIHADFMCNNILKNENNEYRLLDFGVVNYAPRIVDVAVFLAGFCLNPQKPLEYNLLAYKTGLDEYNTYLPLTPLEMTHIGTMTRAAYAIFHIAATHDKIVEKSKIEENDYWIKLGTAGLELTKKMGL
jgi:Ser/Thr protein kinase RdoA (MazF antagonist)